MEVDVVIAGDFRFPGGTSTSIASEVRALAGAGYDVGLLSIASSLLSPWRTLHPELFELVETGAARFVPPGEPVRAGLCALHHPVVFEQYPAVAPKVRAEQSVLVVHHPPVDAEGTPQYPYAAIDRICCELFGPVSWAPVGPKVRGAFSRLSDGPPLTPDDWLNIVDPEMFAGGRDGFIGAIPVIGRHSRPDPLKWPDRRETFLQAYPADKDFRVRLMGYDRKLEAIVGERPENWQVLEFGAMLVPQFLAGIDYFSYYHGSTWIEAFGRAILEAMATGLVCLLPPHFADLFGAGAIYCPERDVAETVRAFHDDPLRYARQSEQAVAVVREQFGPSRAVERVRDRIGRPRRRRGGRANDLDPRRQRVLYFTSNGVGMGHLTRTMASARRLRPAFEPVIVTMSKAFGVVREQGMLVEYLPYFRSIPISETVWHQSLTAETTEMLRFYRPEVFVFDGNVPYRGLLDALAEFPGMWKVWQRRGMWRPDAGAKHVERESAFDVVIEPGELAAAMDRGLTTRNRSRTLAVPPIRYLRDGEELNPQAARAALGLDGDRPAVLLQLGSGNNFRIGEVLALVYRHLKESCPEPKPQIVVGEWRNSNAAVDLPGDVLRLRTFPISRFLAAFDYGVAMAGYNTFHENLAAGIPTLFLSNDNPEQDEQWLRAEYGAVRGLCLAARSHDLYAVGRGLVALGEPRLRESLRSACGAVPQANGADLVARFLGQLALTRKVNPAAGVWAPGK